MGSGEQFRCYNCGGTSFRVLNVLQQTAECLQCGRASPLKPPQSVFATTVEVSIDGQNYGGAYAVEGQTVTVRCGRNVKSAQLGGVATSPETLARLLLAEIVSEQTKADKE